MRAPWDRRRLAAVAAGGVAGAALRWAVLTSIAPGRFPWPVLAMNLAGSFILGLLLAEEWDHPARRLLLHDAGGIGFCGGLTTFSTFAVEAVELVRDGYAWLAAIYVTTSVAGSVLGVMAGAGALRRLRALRQPLESEP